MDLRPALDWDPPDEWLKLTVVDAHTGGEPFRLVIDGLPDIPGATVLERRRYAMENLDYLRRAMILEPRGHADMYGGWIGDPVEPGSDLSVLFLHNEGFSTMCGHGVIALTKVVVGLGLLPGPDLAIDTPSGTVEASASLIDGQVEQVSFRNVPSFCVATESTIDVPQFGTVRYDLAFGGAFYAYVDSKEVGVSLDDPDELKRWGRKIKRAIAGAGPRLEHPLSTELAFLYGVIFTGTARRDANHSRNVCVFADGEIDRSPTGTGVSGRLAILHARNEVAVGDEITVESIVGSEFTGRIVDEAKVGPFPGIVPELTGSANLTGRSELWIDPDDVLGAGFLLDQSK